MSTININENCDDCNVVKSEPRDNKVAEAKNCEKGIKIQDNLVTENEKNSDINIRSNESIENAMSQSVSDKTKNENQYVKECISVSNNNEDRNRTATQNIHKMANNKPNTDSVIERPNTTFSDISDDSISQEQEVPSDSSSDTSTNLSDNQPDILVNEVSKLEITEKKPTPIKKSAVIVVNKESDSLKNLLVYEDDDSSESSSESSVESSESDSDATDIEIDVNSVWIKASSTSESESVYEDSDATDDDVSSEILISNKSKGAIKKDSGNKKEEDCLPPVPDLSSYKINVDKEEFMHIGHIDSVIEKLVTIEAIPGTPAFDLDSCLFIEDKVKSIKKPIGEIFDVLGPVTSPLYCIRFNNTKDIEELKLTRGMKIFVAPKSEYTKYVFVKELMKMKGTDASWLNDQEIPPEMAEFSDDEAEREARKPKTLKRKHGSLERHQRYEQTMNKCNILNTRVSRLMDAHQHLSRSISHQKDVQRQNVQNMINNTSTMFNAVHPAPFNPSVPPPGFGNNEVTPPFRQPPSPASSAPRVSAGFQAGSPSIGPPGAFDAPNGWVYPPGNPSSVPPPGFNTDGATPPLMSAALVPRANAGLPGGRSPVPCFSPGPFDTHSGWTYPQGAGQSRQGQSNSANYHTNNGRGYYPAGPSSYHPF